MRQHFPPTGNKMPIRISISFLTLLVITAVPSQSCNAQGLPAHPGWPGPGQLFVGTCYQPVDRSPEEIDYDIAIMKRAGFNVVRMGDLSWDFFEPQKGKFAFKCSTRSWTRCRKRNPRDSGHSRLTGSDLAASSLSGR